MLNKILWFSVFTIWFLFNVQCKGEKIIINNKDDFNNLVQLSQITPFNYDVELNVDLDFESEDIQPLGTTLTGKCIPFSGTFNGKGHSIKNVTVIDDYASFFCHLKNAVVKNLVFESSCAFRGKGSSSVSATASGEVVLQNIINRAPVYGHYLGAAGLIQNDRPASRLFFLNCVNEGDVSSIRAVACGLSCSLQIDSEVFIFNSANKGNIFGNFVFGICPKVFFADNVINTGIVTGSYKDSFWDWESSMNTFYVYGIDVDCVNCASHGVTVFKRNSDGSYVLKKKRKLLMDVLNENVRNMHYGSEWTKELQQKENTA